MARKTRMRRPQSQARIGRYTIHFAERLSDLDIGL